MKFAIKLPITPLASLPWEIRIQISWKLHMCVLFKMFYFISFDSVKS